MKKGQKFTFDGQTWEVTDLTATHIIAWCGWKELQFPLDRLNQAIENKAIIIL